MHTLVAHNVVARVQLGEPAREEVDVVFVEALGENRRRARRLLLQIRLEEETEIFSGKFFFSDIFRQN